MLGLNYKKNQNTH